jgi:hypothetical protein
MEIAIELPGCTGRGLSGQVSRVTHFTYHTRLGRPYKWVPGPLHSYDVGIRFLQHGKDSECIVSVYAVKERAIMMQQCVI